MISYSNSVLAPANWSATNTPAKWGVAGQSRSTLDQIISGHSKKGTVITPSFVVGTWGRMTNSGGIAGAYIESRTSYDGGGTWSAWSISSNIYLSNSPGLISIQYRWRIPLPGTGYFKIEWDELSQNRGGGAGGMNLDSFVVDDCYRFVSVFASASSSIFMTSAGGYGLEKMRCISGTYLLGGQPSGGTVTADVTATDINLIGIAVDTRSGAAAEQAPIGFTNIEFSPDNGAVARARHALLYADSTPTTGNVSAVGSILDDPGSPVTYRQSLTVAGQSSATSLRPRYNGGGITSISVASGATWPTGVPGLFMLIPNYFDSASPATNVGMIVRPIFSGTGDYTITYTPRSFEITEADLDSSYHPFIPSTWPASPIYDLNSATDYIFLTCPRFFLHP